jgi:hypothetical protein
MDAPQSKVEEDMDDFAKRAKERAATSGQGGPALDALRKIGKKGDEEKEPVKKKAGGMVKSSASKRADGIAKKGKTKGRMV